GRSSGSAPGWLLVAWHRIPSECGVVSRPDRREVPPTGTRPRIVVVTTALARAGQGRPARRRSAYSAVPAIPACSASAWAAALVAWAFRDARNCSITVANSLLNVSGATAPCARLPTISFVCQSSAADWRYALYFDRSLPVRAAMDPFLGWKTTWPSTEPSRRSHAITLSRFGAPTGRPNESASMLNTPSVPGAGAQPKPSPGVRPSVVLI